METISNYVRRLFHLVCVCQVLVLQVTNESLPIFEQSFDPTSNFLNAITIHLPCNIYLPLLLTMRTFWLVDGRGSRSLKVCLPNILKLRALKDQVYHNICPGEALHISVHVMVALLGYVRRGRGCTLDDLGRNQGMYSL